MAQRSGLTAHFVADPLPTRLPAEIEIACYRVAQESLNNVVRHAQARQVYIELRRVGGELRLVVRDDGLGFNARAARLRAVQGDSFGLLGMEERVLLLGGSFKIKSAPQGGTQVRACFPLTQSTRKKTTKTGSL
jgi:two-component system sensor histidine kinase UhpB